MVVVVVLMTKRKGRGGDNLSLISVPKFTSCILVFISFFDINNRESLGKN